MGPSPQHLPSKALKIQAVQPSLPLLHLNPGWLILGRVGTFCRWGGGGKTFSGKVEVCLRWAGLMPGALPALESIKKDCAG